MLGVARKRANFSVAVPACGLLFGLDMKRERAAAERRTFRCLLGETRGAVLAEYVAVLAFLIVLALSLLLAVGLIQRPSYSLQREALSRPYP